MAIEICSLSAVIVVFSSGLTGRAIAPGWMVGKKYIGAHLSIASGLHSSVYAAKKINATAIAFFVSSPKRWSTKEIEESQISLFRNACLETGMDPAKQILVHGSYMANIANPDSEKRNRSISLILSELKKCEQLGIELYNFHPGSTVGKCSIKEAVRYVAEAINYFHKNTKKVICVIETMAGDGNKIGSSFKEIRQMIDLVDDKTRVGVCIDTCHVFSAGYPLKTKGEFEQTMSHFESEIGIKYLQGMHLNDSMNGFFSKKDRHQHIGKGEIGDLLFRYIMNDPRFDGVPLILETPNSNLYEQEIKMLSGYIEAEPPKTNSQLK